MDYSIILPAYNEESTVERAIRETAAVFDQLTKTYEIIVVDDGSTDTTARVVNSVGAERSTVRLVQHGSNRGKGEAVRTGVINAHGDFLLFLDCDLATHPREARAFIDKMGENDIVIGSRRVAGAVIARPQPWHRSLSGRSINLFVRHFLKLPHYDTQCGFKMFRSASAKSIFKDIGSSRWTFDIEILLRARDAGYKVVELPVTWTNGPVSRVKANEVLFDLWYLVKLKNQLNK
jgi:dolichyl-phosphate beta-glucosyltransferase